MWLADQCPLKPCHHSQIFQGLEEIGATGHSPIALARSWKLLVSPAFLQEWFWHKTWKNRIEFHLQCWIMQPTFNVAGQSISNQNHVITPKLFNALNRSYWSLMDCPLLSAIYFWVVLLFCSHEFDIRPRRTKHNSISNTELCIKASMWLANHCPTKTISSIPSCSMPWRDRSCWSLMECPLLADRNFWSALLFCSRDCDIGPGRIKQDSTSNAESCNQDSMLLVHQCPTKTMSSLPSCSMSWRDRRY